jgi:hypothetical protein
MIEVDKVTHNKNSWGIFLKRSIQYFTSLHQKAAPASEAAF